MANEMVKAIKGNDRLDIRAVAEAGDALAAAATSAITALGTAVKGTDWTGETIKGNKNLIVANIASIDALQRTGSTVTVAGAVADAGRDVTLTVKNGKGAAVERYAMIGVKVTKGDGNGVDTGNPAVIDTDLVTSTGLVVSSGEQLVPSNGAAISNAGNANLIAFTNADGILKVTPTAKTNNLFVFVHFIMPDGTVEKSAEIKLKEV